MLNRIHWLQRQAEKSTRKGRVRLAIDQHREASSLLEKLLDQIVQEKAAESLKLQQQFHVKEEKLLNEYQAKIDTIARSLGHLKLMEGPGAPGGKPGDFRSPEDYGFTQLKPPQQAHLQSNIYRAFETTESLITQLRVDQNEPKGGTQPSKDSSRSTKTPNLPKKSSSIAQYSADSGIKKPKDDKVIIEELEVANCHLRRMVDSLFVELDHCQRENLELKNRIKDLEEELRLSNQPNLQYPDNIKSSYSQSTDPDQFRLGYLPSVDIDFDLPALELPNFDSEPNRNFED